MGSAQHSIRVTVLGSGDAFGSGGRAHSAYLVESKAATFLIDCGPSVLQTLKANGRDPGAIDFVLLSHLHGDHFGGVPFLLMEYLYESPRTRPLTIYGPPDTERRVRALFAALYEKSSEESLPYAVAYRELIPGRALALEGTVGLEVTPFAVPHAAELVCLGYRVEVDGRSIVYSGDSGWTDDFLAQVRGVDLFLCECTTFEPSMPRFHLSYREIAARARDLGCRRLVLTHLGSETQRHLTEINLECARDGMTIVL
jgi:ribonuclease BN (tRNA processing enzyme)